MNGGMHPGSMLGRYRLVQQVGEGGMGVVHLALDPRGQAVAVKVLRPHVAADPHARQRLAREVATLRRVRHRRVAEVLDADTTGDRPFIVTQYVPAPPLDDLVRLDGGLTGTDLARLGDGLGEALSAVHAAGVVHRDLKPGNVLMLDGDPVVIDFGIAHVADEVRLTSTGLVMGTPGYLSPEVLDGDPVSEATDWWGWAATMAFAATGRAPFGRGPLESVLDRVRRGTPDLDGVPAALVDVLGRALAPYPHDRPAPAELRLAVRDLWEASAVTVVDLAAVESPGTAPAATPQTGWPADREPTVPVPAPVSSSEPDSPAARTTALAAGVPATRVLASPPPAPVHRDPEPAAHPSPPYQPPYEPAQYDPAQYDPVQYDPAAYPPPPFRRPRRTGVLLAGLLAMCAVAAYLPVATAIAGAIWAVLARTVHRAHGGMLRRRYEHGPRPSDRWLAVLGSPWHLLVSTMSSVFTLLLPLLAGVSTVFIAGLVLDRTSPQPGRALPLAAGALVAALVAWWGPGGTSLRHGSRTLARSLTPGRWGPPVAVVALLLIAAGAVLVLMQSGGQPDWTPLPGPPLGG